MRYRFVEITRLRTYTRAHKIVQMYEKKYERPKKTAVYDFSFFYLTKKLWSTCIWILRGQTDLAVVANLRYGVVAGATPGVTAE